MKIAAIFAFLLVALPAVLTYDVPGGPVATTDVAAVQTDASVPETSVTARSVDLYTRQTWTPASNNLGGVVNLFVSIAQMVKDGIQAREEFTRRYVSDARSKWRDFNWVVVCVAHDIGFNGQRGHDWDNWSQKLVLPDVADVTYNIYWFRSGVFIRRGDGGYRNWAYGGNVASISNGGATLTFNPPT